MPIRPPSRRFLSTPDHFRRRCWWAAALLAGAFGLANAAASDGLPVGAELARPGREAPAFVAARGRVVPAGGVFRRVAPPMLLGEPPLVASLLVKVGDEVAEGDALATLAVGAALDRAVSEAQGGVEQARTALAVATAEQEALAAEEVDLGAQVAELGAQVRVAERQVEQARAAVSSLLAGRDAEMSSREAEIALLRAREANLQRLIDEEKPTRGALADLRHQLRDLAAEITSRQATLPSLRARYAAEVAQLEIALAVATAQQSAVAMREGLIDAQRAALIQRQRVAASQVASAEMALAVAELRLAEAAVAVKRATVRAPLGGTVVAIHAYPGEAIGPSGLLEIAPPTPVEIEAEVYIDDILWVQVGQSAEITANFFAGSISAEVTRLGKVVGQRQTFSGDPSAFIEGQVVIVTLTLTGAVPPELRRLYHAPVIARIRTR